MPTVTLLVNPASGRRRAAVVASALRERLRARGAQVRLLMGESAGDSARLVDQLVAQRPDVLVTVGGDGLVHLALQAVVGTDIRWVWWVRALGTISPANWGCPAHLMRPPRLSWPGTHGRWTRYMWRAATI